MDAPAPEGAPGPGEIKIPRVTLDRGIRLSDRIRFDEVGVRAELVQIADKGVDEAVVIIDNQDAHWTVTSCGLTNWLIHGKT